MCSVFPKLGGPFSTGTLRWSPPPALAPTGAPEAGSPSPAPMFSAGRGWGGISIAQLG